MNHLITFLRKPSLTIPLVFIILFLIVACESPTDSDESKKVTITFNSNGGTIVPTQLLDAGGFIIEPKEPVKVESTFLGWYTDPNFQTPWSFTEYKVTENVTLYAKWSDVIKVFSITFESNGGSIVESQSVEAGGFAFSPNPPTKDGFEFSGWYSDIALTSPWPFATGTVTQTMTLYAKWTLKGTVLVSFNSKGGSLIESFSVKRGDLIQEPINPIRTKHQFDGWYEDEALSSPWNFSSDIVTGDITLYAKWLRIFAVAFDAGDGVTIDTQFILPNTLPTPPEPPIKNNFIFEDWYSSSAYIKLWDFENDSVKSDTTIYAKWRDLSTNPMILFFDTDDSRAGTTIYVPLNGIVDVSIDWGDGIVEEIKTAGVTSHTYDLEGEYYVKIYGTLSMFGFTHYYQIGEYKQDELIRVDDFGEIGLKSLRYAFTNAPFLVELPNTLPSSITDLNGMCYKNFSFNANISSWNTINVTDMDSLFAYAHEFDQDISSWNTENVRTMIEMFSVAQKFNQDIGSWNTGNVTDMSSMFSNAKNFNQNIGNWDVKNVTTMESMFYSALSFNQSLNQWNTGNVTDMSSMFSNAKSFNQNIDSWNTGNVTDMSSMFRSTDSFNQDIGNWNTGEVTTMERMFCNAISFNQNLNLWNTANVLNLEGMFSGASSFNGIIGNWNTSYVTNMDAMFFECTEFNQDINSWNIGRVRSIGAMFYGASSFNQDLSNWNTENVTNMGAVFYGAISFNGSLSTWSTENVTTMGSMFKGATSFNRELGDWNTGNVAHMDEMFNGATNFNQDIGSWNTSKVQLINAMFKNATSFNQNLKNWDMSTVGLKYDFDLGATAWEYKNKPIFN